MVVLTVLYFGVEILYYLHLMYVFIFVFMFVELSGRLLGNSCSLG